MDDYRIGYIDGVASRDAEVAELNRQLDLVKFSTPALDSIGITAPSPRVLMENYRKLLEGRYEANILCLKQERDQLREHVKMLWDALDYVIRDLKLRADMKEDDEHGIVDIGDGALIQAEEALAATEPKP